MKVKTLIKKLEKMDPEAEVRLHDKTGESVLFVLCAKKYPDVWLQTEGDVYKMPNEVIVPGRYTDEQIKMIIDCLDDRMYFIPDKVGFPEKKFDTETEDDHPWFELDELDFEDSAEAPQIDKSPEEVVDLFLAAKGHWEE